MGRVWNFLLLCVHYIPLLMLFNIELLRTRNIFLGGREINWSLGLGEIPGLPPFQMKPCECELPAFKAFFVCLFVGRGGFCLIY